jgi:mono/diheme cytochrome c family protein
MNSADLILKPFFKNVVCAGCHRAGDIAGNTYVFGEQLRGVEICLHLRNYRCK